MTGDPTYENSYEFRESSVPRNNVTPAPTVPNLINMIIASPNMTGSSLSKVDSRIIETIIDFDRRAPPFNVLEIT